MGRLQGYKKVIDHIRSEYKLYASIVVGTIVALGWASTQFVTSAKAEGTHKQLESQISEGDARLTEGLKKLTESQVETNKLLTTFISRAALQSVKTAIKTNDSETFQIEQSIRLNGTDSQSEKRLNQLRAERADLEMKRTCIINNNPICD